MKRVSIVKKLILISIAAFTLLSLLGCASTSDAENETSTDITTDTTSSDSSDQPVTVATASEGSTIARIQADGVLRVVCILSTPPFGMINDQGEPEGFDVDVARELADSLGVELEVIDSVDAANRVPYITSNKADVAIATLGITLERAQAVAFTDPYIRDGQVIVAPKGSSIKTLEDLAGLKVGLVSGGPQDLVAEQYLQDSEVLRYGTVADTFMALKQGKVDAVVEGKSISDYQATLNPELEVVADPFTTLYWGFAAAKGDNDWINYLNLFIRQLNISGKRAELYAKWFGGAAPASLTPTY